MELSDRNYVILRTSKVRIKLDLLNQESVSGESSGRASL